MGGVTPQFLGNRIQVGEFDLGGWPFRNIRVGGVTEKGAFKLPDFQPHVVQFPKQRIAGGNQPGDILPPRLFPQPEIDGVVEFQESRIDASLYGAFPQQPPAEGMDGADVGAFRMVKGVRQPFPCNPFRLTCGFLQRYLEPGAKFRRRLAGEGNRRQAADIAFAFPQQGNHAVDHAPGLAGSG